MISRNEAIDHLLRNRQLITEDSIQLLIDTGFTVIDPDLTKADIIDRNMITALYETAVQTFADTSERTERLVNKYKNTAYDVISRLERVHREVELVAASIRDAQVSERNMSGHVDTLNIDFSDNAVINWTDTTATLSDGLVIGVIKDRSKANKEQISIAPISFRFAKAIIRSVRGKQNASLQLITNDGATLPHPTSTSDYKIVNSGKPFILYGSTDYREPCKLDLFIDRESEDTFNQIELNLEKAEIVSLYTSIDGKVFNKEFDTTRYAKNTVFPIGKTTARYIKIVFHKQSPSKESYGKYIYKTRINSLNVLRATVNEPAVVVTNNIAISGQYTSMAIDTCDSISNPNTDIQYHISVNDGEWREVRPSDKNRAQTILSPVSLRTDDFSNNKIISLIQKTKVNKNYVYEVDLPGEFLTSNTIRVFAEDITGTNHDWNEEHDYWSICGILYEKKVLKLGSTKLEINGQWLTGDVTLEPGLYKVRTTTSRYGNLFITKDATLVNAMTGEYHVVDKAGNVRIITDLFHPYNHKIIVESVFDFIFLKELKERRDFTFYSAEQGYRISTPEEFTEVLVTYQLHSSFVSNVKIKATLLSKNSTSIPYIGKLILRLS